jgi:hypothetical protein
MGNKVYYPVDDITRLVTCALVIRYGINNNRTKKVGTSIAILGRKFHGSDIPDDCWRVEVTMVAQGSEDDMLDIPGPKEIKTLGQAIKNFILWPRRDVKLVDPPTSSSSHPQPSPPPQTLVHVHPSSPPQSSHAAPHPLSNPRLRHKHQHLGHHHLLHNHQGIHDNQRNLNSLYQNWCPHSRKRRVKLLLLAQLDF